MKLTFARIFQIAALSAGISTALSGYAKAQTAAEQDNDPFSLIRSLLRGAGGSNYRWIDFEWAEGSGCFYLLPTYGEPRNDVHIWETRGTLSSRRELETAWLHLVALEFDLPTDQARHNAICVDIVSLGADGRQLDTLRGLTLTRFNQTPSGRLTHYRSGIYKPFILVDSAVPEDDRADLRVLRAAYDGSISVTFVGPAKSGVPSAADKPARLAFFGDLSHRTSIDHVADVWASLDSIGRFPAPVITRLTPEILHLVNTSRSGQLSQKAVELLLQYGDSTAIDALVAFMNEQANDYRRLRGAMHPDYSDKVHLVQGLVASHLSLWGSAARTSPRMRSFLTRLADATHQEECMSTGATAAETLLEILETKRERRALLLHLAEKPSVSMTVIMNKLPPLVDKKALIALHKLAAQEPPSWSAIHVLGEVGDPESMPLLESLTTHGNRDIQQHASEALKKIQLVSPPENLIGYLRQPEMDSKYSIYFWALARSAKTTLDREQLRQAILEGAASLSSWDQVSCRESGLKLGLLKEGDLADAKQPFGNLVGGCSSGPIRYPGPSQMPIRPPNSPSWTPNLDNYGQFAEWSTRDDVMKLDNDDWLTQVKTKCSTLSLLAPTVCNPPYVAAYDAP